MFNRNIKNPNHETRVTNCFFNFVLLFLVSSFCFLSSACNDPQKTTREYMPNMVDSPAVKAQEEAMRLPPEGTVPQGFNPYTYTKDQGDIAGAALNNPLPMTKANLLKGKKMFDTFCIVCHGSMGKGNGLIVPKFPMPPSLQSEKVRGWSDGRIFHVISTGQNLMPSYASQISQNDRWAIVNYIRAVQRSVHPTDDDLKVWDAKTKN